MTKAERLKLLVEYQDRTARIVECPDCLKNLAFPGMRIQDRTITSTELGAIQQALAIAEAALKVSPGEVYDSEDAEAWAKLGALLDDFFEEA